MTSQKGQAGCLLLIRVYLYECSGTHMLLSPWTFVSTPAGALLVSCRARRQPSTSAPSLS